MISIIILIWISARKQQRSSNKGCDLFFSFTEFATAICYIFPTSRYGKFQLSPCPRCSSSPCPPGLSLTRYCAGYREYRECSCPGPEQPRRHAATAGKLGYNIREHFTPTPDKDKRITFYWVLTRVQPSDMETSQVKFPDETDRRRNLTRLCYSLICLNKLYRQFCNPRNVLEIKLKWPLSSLLVPREAG